jgi:sterol desaturase/sphingolipid hydroxylase (fatty acid hydroxylase superfamily)
MLSKINSILTFPVRDLSWPEFTSADAKTFVILAAFAILFALEARWGYRKSPAKTARQSYLTNLGTFILNDTMMSLMSVSSLWVLAERFSNWGLLSWIPDPVWKSLLSFLLLDLTLYFWHRANHSFDCLWMFHKVHHSDRCMNVSTAFRLHFVEVVLTTLVKAAFVLLMGVDAAVLLANEAVITLFVLFHHSNIRFAGEHWLARLTIVPYLHRVHHSARRKEHDNNYGAVFSFWDRMFGTLAELEPAEIGLKHVPGQGLRELIRFGLTPALPPSQQYVEKMIAEAAYYRAEKRGFAPGYDYSDWLEAEKEITGLRQRSS